MNKQEDISDQSTSQPYEPPRLDVLGTVASLTQGGSGGFTDAGSLGGEETAGGSGNIH